MRIKVLKDFIAKEGVYIQAGSICDMDIPEDNDRFYKSLLEHKFIKCISDLEKDVIKSKLANVIIAGCDYTEGDKKYFTWDEAMALKDELTGGWRLPTRSEWMLICEEFGQKDGRLNGNTLIENLGVCKNGTRLGNGYINFKDEMGYYWSSTTCFKGRYYMAFDRDISANNNTDPQLNGFSVRLVKNVEE